VEACFAGILVLVNDLVSDRDVDCLTSAVEFGQEEHRVVLDRHNGPIKKLGWVSAGRLKRPVGGDRPQTEGGCNDGGIH
jgi:hypothetical protein